MGEDLSHGDEVLRPYLVRPFSNGNAVNLLTDLEPALYRMVRLVKDLGRIDSIFLCSTICPLAQPLQPYSQQPGQNWANSAAPFKSKSTQPRCAT